MYRRTETGIWSFIKYLCVLALVKPDEVTATYRTLKSNRTFCPNVEGADAVKVKDFYKYYEKYLGVSVQHEH